MIIFLIPASVPCSIIVQPVLSGAEVSQSFHRHCYYWALLTE